jgi:hypothetical protein
MYAVGLWVISCEPRAGQDPPLGIPELGGISHDRLFCQPLRSCSSIDCRDIQRGDSRKHHFDALGLVDGSPSRAGVRVKVKTPELALFRMQECRNAECQGSPNGAFQPIRAFMHSCIFAFEAGAERPGPIVARWAGMIEQPSPPPFPRPPDPIDKPPPDIKPVPPPDIPPPAGPPDIHPPIGPDFPQPI